MGVSVVDTFYRFADFLSTLLNIVVAVDAAGARSPLGLTLLRRCLLLSAAGRWMRR